MNSEGGSRVAVNFAKRIVVKVGTSTLTYDNGKMNLNNIERLAPPNFRIYDKVLVPKTMWH